MSPVPPYTPGSGGDAPGPNSVGTAQIQDLAVTLPKLSEEVQGILAASGGGSPAAVDVTYDNGTSGLAATDAQAALDELTAFSLLLDSGLSELRSRGEVVQAHLIEPAVGLTAGTNEISTFDYVWDPNMGGGIFASWNAVLNRLLAIQAGRFRITYAMGVSGDPSGSGVAVELGAYVTRDDLSQIMFDDYRSQAFLSQNNVATLGGSKIVDLEAGEEIHLSVSCGVSSGALAVTVTSDASTWVQLEYLGPTPT